jgi:hypothetical protein
VKSMLMSQTFRLSVLVLGLSLCAVAQDNSSSGSQTPSTTTAPSTTPAPAFGQENAPILNPENPPVTGLDEPSLELHTATRSFISPALQASESGDTNGANSVGHGAGAESVTRILGALDLQQFWPKTDVFLEYLGGGAFYSSPYQVKQLQAVGFEGVTRWRTGQLTLRDSLNYLPDGSFSIGTFGGVPGFGLATGSGGLGSGVAGIHGLSNNSLGAIGDIPRLANTAIMDAVQAINPVSAITVAGGFSNAHFFDSADCAVPGNTCLINSDEVTVEGGYTRVISRHDQLGAVYAYQLFQFPQDTGGQFYTQVLNVRWKYYLSGRMSLTVGVGPQYTVMENDSDQGSRWSPSARVLLNYKFAHSSMGASYEKYTSSGSGFFTGADTQAARLLYTRPLGRTWKFYGDLAYSHDKKLQDSSYGVQAGSYNEGSVAAILRKHIGRTYDFFTAYRFSEVAFDSAVTIGTNTGRIANRNVGSIGIEWHPTPTRIE